MGRPDALKSSTPSIRTTESFSPRMLTCITSAGSAIATDSQVINDFAEFFRTHARIELICFNGGKAAQSFRRQIAPTLPSTTLRYVQLPSTSPAHAALNFDAKLQRWRDALHGFQSTAKSSR